MLEEATLITCPFNICCRFKWQSFLNVGLVLVWLACLASVIGVPQ